MSSEEKNIHYFSHSIGWNLCCKQATYLLLRKEELTKLSFKEESALKFHMAICRFCRAFKKQSELMNELIRKSIKTNSFILAPADKNNLKALISKGLNDI
ncbi:MAG: hypothetical protein ACXVC6_15025 [Bacteroidia bacterium]